jgi:hypothetical protein
MNGTIEKEYFLKEYFRILKRLGEAWYFPEPKRTFKEVAILKEEIEKAKNCPEPERTKQLRIIREVCMDLARSYEEKSREFRRIAGIAYSLKGLRIRNLE